MGLVHKAMQGYPSSVFVRMGRGPSYEGKSISLLLPLTAKQSYLLAAQHAL